MRALLLPGEDPLVVAALRRVVVVSGLAPPFRRSAKASMALFLWRTVLLAFALAGWMPAFASLPNWTEPTAAELNK